MAMVTPVSQNVVMLKNNSRIEYIQKEMERIQEEGAKQEGNYMQTLEGLQIAHIPYLSEYVVHSAALPNVYLSPCIYMSPALIW